MRIALKFKVDSELTLPKSYQHHVQGFIYNLIKGTDFSDFLHNEGYGEERKFKLFTFSLLKGPYTYNSSNHTVTFKDFFYIEITSVVEAFIEHITMALLKEPHQKLNGCLITLDEYRYKTKKITSSQIKIEMMSPVTVYKTVDENGSQKTVYFKPEDTSFSEYIDANLKRKFASVYEGSMTPSVSIHPLEVKNKDKLVIKYKNQVIIAYKGKYLLKGHPEFLDFLFRTGLGSKNSMGFGMFRLIK